MNTYFITHRVGGYNKGVIRYIGYTKKEAIKQYREAKGLKHKRIDLVVSRNFIS